ncbi:MAG TPA: efflux RND transporter periplasmic adaptor subunit [Thermoanaerobaculia bacterium]|nr:efflux RND transporter periplasmic adaptor subunit [Thermoanaerobaculia bacterium]HUM29181.1 efflux RND transporter periplasmic adaptor subunit [Thermoanaerobaculia bacterium]HXK67559.1 efflux RND transporter periplasmic adaptor subunit [Thermoanaerobaculia bacterium]
MIRIPSLWLRYILLLSLFLGLVLLSACTDLAGNNEEKSETHETAREEGDHEAEEHEETSVTLKNLNLQVETAAAGTLELVTELVGEVKVNEDRMAHVAPRVSGIVQSVYYSLGDQVSKGDVLATLSSRELADTKAAYLAARERLSLAESTYTREETLFTKKISSEQEYLDARNGLAEARIESRSAEQKLLALGFTPEDCSAMTPGSDDSLTRYPIQAPFDGIVIERHLTLGETAQAESPIFTIADLSTVWIDLQVYQKDIGHIRAGQMANIKTDHGTETSIPIKFVQPLMGKETRTALARLITENHDGRWHPGCFVTAEVITETLEVSIRVPREAVVALDDGVPVVFVRDDHGYDPVPVKPGREDRNYVEILSGLNPGDPYVSRGAFSLRAERMKGSLGHGHAH